MSLFYRISVDLASSDYISGWCFHRWHRNRTVELQLFQAGTLLGEMTADRKREDLAALGVHPSGRCGFELVISNPPLPAKKGNLVLREKESQCILAEIEGKDHTVLKSKNPLDFLKRRIFGTQRGARPILFMHIPKTAGTSFNTLVRSLLPPEKVISHIEALDKDSYAPLTQQYHFISGHLRYGVFKKHFSHADAELFTIIREPYSHLHSHLKWMAVTAADTPDNSPKFRNQAIYRIAKRVGETDFGKESDIERFVQDIRIVGAPFFDNMQTRHFLTKAVDQVTEDHLNEAIANAEGFRLIGFTEEYPEFVRSFAGINRLKTPDTTGTLNRSPSPPLFDLNSPTIREMLSPLVHHDLKLHNHIRRKS